MCVYRKKYTYCGRLLKLKKFFRNGENFMLTYGDGLTNQNIKKLVNFHIKHKKIATMTTVKPPARFGEVFLKGSRITKFEEKPQLNENWINGGFFVFSYEIFKFIKEDQIMLERQPLTKLTKINQLRAFRHTGFWQCMDTTRDKNILLSLLKNKKAPWIRYK